jgi:hypothetical protein
LFLARITTFGIHAIPWSIGIIGRLQSIAPFPYVGTAILAFGFGPAIAWLINQRVDPVSAKEVAVRQTSDELLYLLFSSMAKKALVMVTMDTGSVYIGYVLDHPNLERGETKSIILLPMRSGYRDKNDLTTKFTNNYLFIYRDLLKNMPANEILSKFGLVLPYAGIKSARLYDPDIDPSRFIEGPAIP